MATVRKAKIHDPKNPNNFMWIDDPEHVPFTPPGHDIPQRFDPKKHVKWRSDGSRYTVEEEMLLAEQNSKYEKRRAELGLDRKEPDHKDLEIQRLRRELEEARLVNSSQREASASKDTSSAAPTSSSTSHKAPAAKEASKPTSATKKSENQREASATDEDALSGLAGTPNKEVKGPS